MPPVLLRSLVKTWSSRKKNPGEYNAPLPYTKWVVNLIQSIYFHKTTLYHSFDTTLITLRLRTKTSHFDFKSEIRMPQ